MSIDYKGYSINDLDEAEPWTPREIAFHKALIDKSARGDDTIVTTQHVHAKLVSPDKVIDPVLITDNNGNLIVSAIPTAIMRAGKDLITFAALETVINEDQEDRDFRVESNTKTHALFLNAANYRFGINESSPDVLVHMTDTFVLNNAVTYLMRLTGAHAGTTTGFGTGFEIELADAGGGLDIASQFKTSYIVTGAGIETAQNIMSVIGSGALKDVYAASQADTTLYAYGTGTTLDDVLKVEAVTTADAVAGFGPAIVFQITDDASVTHGPLAKIGGIRGSADDEGDLVLYAGTNGAEEFARINEAGDMGIGVDAEAGHKLHVYEATAIASLLIETDGSNVQAGIEIRAGAIVWQMYVDENQAGELHFINSAPNIPAVFFEMDGQIHADLGAGAGNVTVFDDYDDPRELAQIIQGMDLDRGVEIGILSQRGDKYYLNYRNMMLLLAGACYQLDARLKVANL